MKSLLSPHWQDKWDLYLRPNMVDDAVNQKYNLQAQLYGASQSIEKLQKRNEHLQMVISYITSHAGKRKG